MIHDWWKGKNYDVKVIAKDLLMRHEGIRLKPYRCSAGKLTIGVGRNLEDKGISSEEAMAMLYHDINSCHDLIFARYGWFRELNEIRKAVVIDMVFNLGMRGFHSFKLTRRHISNHDYDLAAKEMLRSKWAEQVGYRAEELAEMMRSGKESIH